LLLEQFVSTELEGTLKEISSGGGTKTSQESTGTFSGDDLSESSDHTLVVGDGVKLDTSLDAVEVSLGTNFTFILTMEGFG
jgi:hypothetical protein